MTHSTRGLLLAGALFSLLSSAHAATPADPLTEARTLVAQRRYLPAIQLYEQIETNLWLDPGLIVELARVYLYADRHAEAIQRFEAVRARDPAQLPAYRNELGEAYLWHGQPALAIPLFRQSLTHNPHDLRARLGLARGLAWNNQRQESLPEFDTLLQETTAPTDGLTGKADALSHLDRLAEAIALYTTVLASEPDNLEARCGIARCRVWQGYHRQGRDLYLAILRDHPRHAEALTGLAYAQHWDGRDDQAVQTLAQLATLTTNQPAAKSLTEEIQSSQEPYVTQLNRFWWDKYRNALELHSLRTGLRLDELTALDAIYDWRQLRDRHYPDLAANRVGLGGTHTFGDLLTGNAYLYQSDYQNIDFHPLTANTWLTLRPDDLWRLDVAYDRETFETQSAVRHHLVTDSGSASVDLTPNRWLLFSGKYKQSDYSDDNEQHAFFGKAELRLFGKPYIKSYYNYYWSEWDHPFDHGYFAPASFQSHTLGLYTGFHLTPRLFCEAQSSVGYEQQEPAAENPVYFSALGANYRLTSNWNLFARSEFFHALPDRNHDTGGYRSTTVIFGLTHNFGGTPSQPATETPAPTRSNNH